MNQQLHTYIKKIDLTLYGIILSCAVSKLIDSNCSLQYAFSFVCAPCTYTKKNQYFL